MDASKAFQKRWFVNVQKGSFLERRACAANGGFDGQRRNFRIAL